MYKKTTIVLALILLTGCSNLFFYPMKKEVFKPQQFGLTHDDIFLSTNDNTVLHGWHLPATSPSKSSIIFFHGNAENITTHIASVYWLPENGYEVFLFDYRGYGRSQGTPQIDTVIEDARLMIDYVSNHSTSTNQNFVIFGQSLGAAIAINAAAELENKNLKALIIDSSFSGFRKIAREKLSDIWLTWPVQAPLSLAFTNKYSPKKMAPIISPVPLLVIHGSADKIIPIRHGEEIFQSAKPPKSFWKIEDGRHIDSTLQLNVRERILDFLDMATNNKLPQSQDNSAIIKQGERASITLEKKLD